MQLTKYNVCICEMSGELFKLSCRKNIDSRKFINKLMNSSIGQYLYSDECIDTWLGTEFVFQEIQTEIQFEKGDVINEDVMYWIGYLFKYWSLTFKNDRAKDMIKQAPIDTLLVSYQGLHVMSFKDVIMELKSIYKENNK